MKNLIVSIACLGVLGSAGSAMAFPPPADTPPAKATILHCGCEDNVGMVFREISVSTNATGHAINHVVTDDPEFVRIDECLNEGGVEANFVQTVSDCVTPDSDAELEGLVACEQTVVDTVRADLEPVACGAELVAQEE